jgi:ribosomal-protein-alanine N-acetyltransferase
MIANISSAPPDDLAAILRLARESSTAAHWTDQQYQQMFQVGSEPARLVAVVKSMDSSVVGFLVARHIAPEWELENIVVDPAVRSQGLGKQLIDFLFARARETNSEVVFLEVRESNAAARKLYERAGFDQTGRRHAYYTNPQEDAILYRCKLL